MSGQDWLYLKLYLGKAVDRMDRFIADVAGQLDVQSFVGRWFFLRYFDDTGMHLRLRVEPAPGQVEQASRQVEAICLDALTRLHEYVPSGYHPMVLPVGFSAEDPGEAAARSDVRFEYDTYQPEYDKYGGEAGMDIAEELFMRSSQVAYRMLQDEFDGLYSRKTLVPRLMDECFRAFRPNDDAAAFWQQYSTFWLGGDTPAADDWRETFSRKYRELAEHGIAVCVPEAELTEAAAARLQTWRQAVSEAARRYGEAGGHASVSADVLCVNFAHLMNNRLGLMALEEAYMGTLLEQRASMEVAA